jgi:hypothetical protein
MTGIRPDAEVDSAHVCDESMHGRDRRVRVMLAMPPGDAARLWTGSSPTAG